jgi:hypothetical protein
MSDHGEVEELDDSCFAKLERTNDSFDSQDNK